MPTHGPTRGAAFGPPLSSNNHIVIQATMEVGFRLRIPVPPFWRLPPQNR